MSLNAACPLATSKRKERFTACHYNKLGKSNLYASKISYGSLKLEKDDDSHTLALDYALSQGINVIDTSPNFQNGEAEKTLGRQLNDGFYKQQFQRNEIIIMSHGGLIQGRQLTQVKQRKQLGHPYPNLISIDDQLAYCIHPDYLNDQLSQSLDHLDLSCLDFYLIHQPEIICLQALKAGEAPQKALLKMHEALDQAFDFLEEQVKDGRISFYGIASNTLALHQQNPAHINLENLISKQHPHFALIQVPCNLLETQVITEKNQQLSENILTCAQKHDLGVMVTRPLSSLYQNQKIILKNSHAAKPTTAPPLSFIELDNLEKQLDDLFVSPEEDKENFDNIKNLFRCSQHCQHALKHCIGFEEVKDYFYHIMLPQLHYALSYLYQNYHLEEAQEIWLKNYLSHFKQIAQISIEKERPAYLELQQKIKACAQKIFKSQAPLSQLAIGALAQHPAISTITVSLKEKDYVDDALEALNLQLTYSENLWKNLNNTLRNTLSI